MGGVIYHIYTILKKWIFLSEDDLSQVSKAKILGYLKTVVLKKECLKFFLHILLITTYRVSLWSFTLEYVFWRYRKIRCLVKLDKIYPKKPMILLTSGFVDQLEILVNIFSEIDNDLNSSLQIGGLEADHCQTINLENIHSHQNYFFVCFWSGAVPGALEASSDQFELQLGFDGNWGGWGI